MIPMAAACSFTYIGLKTPKNHGFCWTIAIFPRFWLIHVQIQIHLSHFWISGWFHHISWFFIPPPCWLVTLMPSLQVFSGRGNHTGAAAQGEKIGSYPPSLATFARNVGEEYFRGDLCVFFASNSNKINPWVTRKVLAYCISLHQSCQIIFQSAYTRNGRVNNFFALLCQIVRFFVSVPKSLAHSLVTLDSPSDWHQLGCSSHMGICICNMQGGWISS